MRPSPAEVRAWFVGALTDEVLAAYPGVLRAAPNWRVAACHIADTLTLQLRYSPTRERLNVTLRYVDALLWPVP